MSVPRKEQWAKKNMKSGELIETICSLHTVKPSDSDSSSQCFAQHFKTKLPTTCLHLKLLCSTNTHYTQFTE